MVFFMSYAASSRNKVPLSSATKMLYTKEDLLKLSGQQPQPQQQRSDKTELDKLFEELPSVPRFVDKDSNAGHSTTSIKTSIATTFDQPISVAALSEQMRRRLTIPKPPTATTTTSRENTTTSSTYISQSASQARNAPSVSAFIPSAPPKSSSSERSTQYTHIPTGTARFENVRPPGSHGTPRTKLPAEYCHHPPFYSASQANPQESFYSEPRPKPPQPAAEPKKKKNCIIS